MNTQLLRLPPESTLRESLEDFCSKHTPKGAAMVTCVGSLSRARLRMAGRKEIVEREGPFEIVSLVGTWTPKGGHWHISLSDKHGQTWGGHLSYGSIVFTTAEIVLVDIGIHCPTREHDPQTGFNEFYVPMKNEGF